MKAGRMLLFLGILAGGYLLWVGALFLLQDRLLFPRQLTAGGVLPPPPGAETWIHEFEPGRGVPAWFVPRPGAAGRAPAVVYFHGNAERAEEQGHVVEAYHRLGWSVLLPEYRGYGPSPGRPSQAAIRADALAFYRRLAARDDVAPRRIVLHGRSIGGGVAADLAAELRRRGDPLPAGLVLESAPASVASLALRYGAPSFLVRSPYRTDEVLPPLGLPVLFFHGRYDRLVPIDDARRLNRLVPGSRLVEFDTGHNDLPSGSQLDRMWDEIRDFIDATAPG